MLQKTVLFLVCHVFAWTVLVQAQTTATEYEQKYKSGKALLAQNKYELAANVFKPLAQENPAHSYQPYAYYYQAFAAFKTAKYDQAKLLLQQLLQKYPDWKNTESASYLLGNVLFEKKDAPSALTYLSEIKNKKIRDEADELKRHYLLQVPDVKTLKTLQQKYPEDKAVAEVLVDRLVASADADDEAFAKQLDEKLKLGRVKEIEALEKISKKDVYNVAVLFPFQVDALDPAKARNNQFALDMYEGIKQAKDELAGKGVKLNVVAYDVGNNADQMLNVVNLPEFASMDLLIGPLYGPPNKVAVAFANQRNVALINPISNNAQLIVNNPAAYLLQPSAEMQARQAAEYAAKAFTPKSAVILYGESPKDSLMAYTYRKYFTAAGGKVPTFKKFTQKNMADLTPTMEALKPEQVGSLFMSADDQKQVVGFMSALEQRPSELEFPVMATANWLDFPMFSYEQFERLNLYFPYPEYVDYGSDTVKAFRREYVAKRNIVPSIYSYQGYGMMQFFGKLLGAYGTYFHNELHQMPPVKGAVLPGYNYQNSNDNQYVPIIRFENASLVLVNPVASQ